MNNLCSAVDRNWASKQVWCKYSTTPRSRSERKGLFHKVSVNDHSTGMRVKGLLWGCPEHICSMTPWRCTRCCSWYLLANTREKDWPARVCFPHLLHCSVLGLDQESSPISVGHREEVVGWRRCARQGLSLQEWCHCTEGTTSLSQEICVWLPAQGWQIHQFTWVLNSSAFAICCPRHWLSSSVPELRVAYKALCLHSH